MARAGAGPRRQVAASSARPVPARAPCRPKPHARHLAAGSGAACGRRDRLAANPGGQHRHAIGCLFRHLAMKRKGFKLTERQMNRIYWDRNKVAAELEASMPPMDPSTIK